MSGPYRSAVMEEAWRTDEELVAARQRFAEMVPGYVAPATYGVLRIDGDGGYEFGHINGPGGGHMLPAAVLASVCGHASGTQTYELTVEEFAGAVERLSPAEAATHVEHPNLWSWRRLLEGVGAGSRFVVFFVAGAA